MIPIANNQLDNDTMLKIIFSSIKCLATYILLYSILGCGKIIHLENYNDYVKSTETIFLRSEYNNNNNNKYAH